MIQGLGHMAMGRSADGLLQEALTVTLESKRHWRSENVDFCQFLKGVIRSTASNWREKYLRREARLGLGDGVRMVEVPLGGPGDPELPIPSPDPGPERVLEAKEMVERLQEMAGEHLYASAIIDEILLGLTGPEIQAKLKISQAEYESAMKWIYRTARKRLNPGGRNG
jgi:DNA-directed RNA polymerase specialized sigma24 family protein